MTESLTRIVYVDANPIIYALEGTEDLVTALKSLFAIFKERQGSAITSELTLAEVLPKRKISDRKFLELLIWSNVFELRPITREILYETVDYRRIAATQRPDGRLVMPKLPDAIHVVTAIKNSCQIFLSLPDTIRFVHANLAGISELIGELA